MTRIQSTAGRSLADAYDVDGSTLSVEELNSREVHLVHEMGSTIFGERLTSFLLRGTSGGIAQSTDFNFTITGFPDAPMRILGVTVIADGQFVTNCAVSIRDDVSNRETPIWIFDTGDDAFSRIRWDDSGAGVIDLFVMRPHVSLLPALLTRVGGANVMPNVVVRGTTSAFGAGTLTTVCLLHVARATTAGSGGLSAAGLPIPSW